MSTIKARRCARHGGLALLCVLLAVHAAHAARGILTTGNMGFGRFAAQGGGTIVIAPNGARTKTGSLILLSSSFSPASFTLDPQGKNKLVIVSLPANGSVLMTNGSSNMAVNNFVSNAPVNGQINTPTYALSVGATLQVAANQAPGNYTGTFAVTVEYQ